MSDLFENLGVAALVWMYSQGSKNVGNEHQSSQASQRAATHFFRYAFLRSASEAVGETSNRS